MTQVIYEYLVKALGGNKLIGGGENKYTNWSPNDVRAVLVGEDAVYVMRHIDGGKVNRTPIDFLKVRAEILDSQYKNPFDAFFFKALSCLEEVYFHPEVWQNIQNSGKTNRFIGRYNSPKHRICVVGYCKPEIGQILAERSGKNDPRKLIAEMYQSAVGVSWQGDVQGRLSRYNLVPRVYKMDSVSLKEHFTKLDPNKGNTEEVKKGKHPLERYFEWNKGSIENGWRECYDTLKGVRLQGVMLKGRQELVKAYEIWSSTGELTKEVNDSIKVLVKKRLPLFKLTPPEVRKAVEKGYKEGAPAFEHPVERHIAYYKTLAQGVSLEGVQVPPEIARLAREGGQAYARLKEFCKGGHGKSFKSFLMPESTRGLGKVFVASENPTKELIDGIYTPHGTWWDGRREEVGDLYKYFEREVSSKMSLETAWVKYGLPNEVEGVLNAKSPEEVIQSMPKSPMSVDEFLEKAQEVAPTLLLVRKSGNLGGTESGVPLNVMQVKKGKKVEKEVLSPYHVYQEVRAHYVETLEGVNSFSKSSSPEFAEDLRDLKAYDYLRLLQWVYGIKYEGLKGKLKYTVVSDPEVDVDYGFGHFPLRYVVAEDTDIDDGIGYLWAFYLHHEDGYDADLRVLINYEWQPKEVIKFFDRYLTLSPEDILAKLESEPFVFPVLRRGSLDEIKVTLNGSVAEMNFIEVLNKEFGVRFPLKGDLEEKLECLFLLKSPLPREEPIMVVKSKDGKEISWEDMEEYTNHGSYATYWGYGSVRAMYPEIINNELDMQGICSGIVDLVKAGKTGEAIAEIRKYTSVSLGDFKKSFKANYPDGYTYEVSKKGYEGDPTEVVLKLKESTKDFSNHEIYKLILGKSKEQDLFGRALNRCFGYVHERTSGEIQFNTLGGSEEYAKKCGITLVDEEADLDRVYPGSMIVLLHLFIVVSEYKGDSLTQEDVNMYESYLLPTKEQENSVIDDPVAAMAGFILDNAKEYYKYVERLYK